ncbi:hypothetical protein STEG23_007305 [Scotinomys teguina]
MIREGSSCGGRYSSLDEGRVRRSWCRNPGPCEGPKRIQNSTRGEVPSPEFHSNNSYSALSREEEKSSEEEGSLEDLDYSSSSESSLDPEEDEELEEEAARYEEESPAPPPHNLPHNPDPLSITDRHVTHRTRHYHRPNWFYKVRMKHKQIMSDLQRLKNDNRDASEKFRELTEEKGFYWYTKNALFTIWNPIHMSLFTICMSGFLRGKANTLKNMEIQVILTKLSPIKSLLQFINTNNTKPQINKGEAKGSLGIFCIKMKMLLILNLKHKICLSYCYDQIVRSLSVGCNMDTGADVTIIAPEFWHPNWPVQEVNVQLLGIGTLSQVKQSARWLECIGPEGQRAKLKPYVANIAMNLWGRDLLKQWNTQINIPPASETNQLTHVSERNTRRYYSNHWSPAIQIVQEQGRTTVDLPKTPTALPLKWLTDKPVWVQQWPLTTEKLQALEELVQEQLNAQHIEESTSPWNSPVFVIKKKSGKWRMVTDLRAINKVIQPMGSLQSGIPLPTLLPKGWPLIVIDLKDCFFSIPLQEKDRERFAFTVPTYNNSQPVKRYQWRVLPQGMLKSPTLCQYFVQQPLEVILKKFPKSIIYHYMDDILLADSNADTLERLFEEVKKILPCWGLQIAPEKIQKGDSINYLGYKIGLQKIRPKRCKLGEIDYELLMTFKDFFGDISHLRTITGVKNDELSNLFKTLEGDKDLNSPRELTPEAEKELALVEKKVQDGHVDRVDPKLDCILVILPSIHSPTGILMQREDIILEWIFLPNKQSKKLKTYVEKISDLILKGKIVWETPISGVHTFYTDANKQGKAGYKSEDLSKVVQSPYNSVQKSELYAILLVLMDFSEPLNIVTDSQYAERVVLHIETAEFIPDESELTSLFIQLQDIIRNRKHPLYITHIRSHTGLPGPLAQGNNEIDKLLIGNMLEASEFHKKHHVNSKDLKRDFSITWQQAKEIVRKCPTCSFYNQTPLPAGCNPKGTQRNDIWQMDVFHFAEFGKLKYVHHTIDTYSGFQWATALSSEKADSVITHLLEVMAIMGIPAQIKTDNAPAYVSGKMKQFLLITI